MMKDYYLGLDLGTGSVGWAVTDENYEVLRAHGKALWGVRLFESAKTAEERRIFRTGRRRLDRRNWRIELLQGIFAEEIAKVDDGFFLRMKESRYVPEDKRNLDGSCPELPYALFVDKDYTDKEYHKQFPTIYHLRKWLMETEEIPDIRLVYLALHHLMKHRGHFLLHGEIENVREFKSIFLQFIETIREEEIEFSINVDEILDEIEEVLKDRKTTKSAKEAKLKKLLGVKNNPCDKAIIKLLVGMKVKLSDIFGDKDLDNCERAQISFSDSGYDEYVGEIESVLGERYTIIELAKAVYDWAVLNEILGNHISISAAKVELYNKHKSDLAYLKKLVRDNLGKDAYKDIFVKTNDKMYNYSAYIGMTKINGKKVALEGKQCNKADFYTFLRKNVLSKITNTEQSEYLKEELDKGTFLPKLVTKDNSVIPYQVHLYELRQIISNLEERMPLLKEKGSKIEQIFSFRIPYYVGPLNGISKGDKKTNWLERKPDKLDEKIYPWNFEEVVDLEVSAEQFIRRMTNKCTYLVKEDVLPKYSLLYSKFMVLNELNNLCINGMPIDVELKQKIYTEVFQHSRKVTQKKLKEYLVREGVIAKTAEVDITGIDGDFKASLTAYHDFKEKLSGCNLSDADKERIILDITLFGDDKKLLKQRLKQLYPQLTEVQRNALSVLSYKGWGRLSRAFLEEIEAPSIETGEICSIIRMLWETNENLMQLLGDKYEFTSEIEKRNGIDSSSEITYKIVDELYVSPAVKRQIWQTLLIVKELCKVLGNPPKRVFVEMAREKAESKRTDSRKKILVDLYKKCKEEEKDWISMLENTEEHTLRSDKLYLYYTQKGRCMYSGEVIELEDLWDNTKYDIDHIYPQSKVMDDSLDNRVLVKKTYNAEKTDVYPIHADIRMKRSEFWKSLLDGGFISKEKYKRLTRATEFEPDELAGFINRQLVETRQGTKAVASVLKQVLPETEIVYVKAKIVSQFRQDFDFVKVREMNDLHHAKDAYLNVVVGNTYYVKFTKNAAWFIKNNPYRSYNLQKMFKSKDVVSGNETAWKAGDNGTIITVRKVMAKNNILVTRRSYQVKGGLFDQQLMKKGKGQVFVKDSDERLHSIEKYGGYNKATGTYFMLVESEDKKGNKIRTIEFVPLYLQEKVKKDEQVIIDYLVTNLNLYKPQILISRIKKDTLFKIEGLLVTLSSRYDSKRLQFRNAAQLILDVDSKKTLKKVLKYVERYKSNPEVKMSVYDKLYENELIDLYDVFLDKLKKKIYSGYLETIKKFIEEKREQFIKLEVKEKCLVISEMLKVFQSQYVVVSYKMLGKKEDIKILRISKNITNCEKISIINQSPTGIYEQEIDLKTV